MRVCVLTTVHAYQDNRIFYKQIRTLLRAGYEVVYIAPCPPGVSSLEGLELVPLPRLSRARRPLNWWRALGAALRSGADLFHFHDPELIGVGMALRVLTDRPVIYDVHEDYPRVAQSRGWIIAPLRPIAAVAMRALEWLAARVFDGIVTPVSAIYDRFRRLNRRSILVRNYVRLDLFDAERSTSPSFDQPYFVYIGAISSTRGVLDCVAAFEELAHEDAGLVLVGPVSDADPLVENLRSRLPAGVHLVGRQPFEDIPSFLRRSCAGLVPIHSTPQYDLALPTKLLEYMAASIPVIASDLPLVRAIVEENDCGLLVEPGNVKQLVDAMGYILDHPQGAEEMGRRGRRAVVERYSWRTEGESLLELYEDLLHHGAQRSKGEATAGRSEGGRTGGA